MLSVIQMALNDGLAGFFQFSRRNKMNNKYGTTKIAWALIRKWADFYGTSVRSMKKLHFGRAMKKAQEYKDADPKMLKKFLGKWL